MGFVYVWLVFVVLWVWSRWLGSRHPDWNVVYVVPYFLGFGAAIAMVIAASAIMVASSSSDVADSRILLARVVGGGVLVVSLGVNLYATVEHRRAGGPTGGTKPV